MNSDVINDYWEALRDGLADLPPVIVFFDGKKYWLADGFHRLGAYGIAHRVDIPADVREGTKRDALRYSLSANDAHGLRRSNEDKRRAVRAALDDEEWGRWSGSHIAELCAVSQQFVSKIQSSLTTMVSESSSPAPDPAPRTYTTKHGTTATMRTGKIGKSRVSEGRKHDSKGKHKTTDPELQGALRDLENITLQWESMGQLKRLVGEWEDERRWAFCDQLTSLSRKLRGLADQLRHQRGSSTAKTVQNEPEAAPEDKEETGEIKELGVGLDRAHEAINCLKRIPKNDALRKRGFQIVTDWIRHNS